MEDGCSTSFCSLISSSVGEAAPSLIVSILIETDNNIPVSTKKEDIESAKAMVEIKVTVHRGTIGEKSRAPQGPRKLKMTDKVHEKTLKGRAMSSKVRYVWSH